MNKNTSIQMHTRERSLAQKLLLSCGIFGSLFFTTTYLIEGAMHPGYNLIRETISALELVSNGWTQQANFIIFGVLILCFTVGLRKELKGGVGALSVPILQGLVAVGLIISGIFIHEPLHTIGDFISFISLVVGFFVISIRFAKDPGWKGWALYSIFSAILMMVFLAAFGNSLHNGGPAGLFERLAGLTRSLWTIIFVGRLLTGKKLASRSSSVSQ